MKYLHYSIIRAIAAAVVGVLLLQHSDGVLKGLTIALGILFLVAGIIAMISWLNNRRKQKATANAEAKDKKDVSPTPSEVSTLPIVSLGSIILGLVLSLMLTQEFLIWSLYLLASVIILGSINLATGLMSVRKMETVKGWLWLPPCLIAIAAIIAMLKGLVPAETTTTILGIASLVYAVAEVIYSLFFYKVERRYEKMQAQLRKAMGQAEEAQIVPAE